MNNSNGHWARIISLYANNCGCSNLANFNSTFFVGSRPWPIIKPSVEPKISTFSRYGVLTTVHGTRHWLFELWRVIWETFESKKFNFWSSLMMAAGSPWKWNSALSTVGIDRTLSINFLWTGSKFHYQNRLLICKNKCRKKCSTRANSPPCWYHEPIGWLQLYSQFVTPVQWFFLFANRKSSQTLFQLWTFYLDEIETEEYSKTTPNWASRIYRIE